MYEEWRSVLGYEGLYEVSSLGRVKSLERSEDSGKGHLRIRRSRVLSTKGAPYPACSLYKNSVETRRTVHSLVAEAFLPNPDNLPSVLHWDDNPQNSRLDNLRWGTAEDNSEDRLRNSALRKPEITQCPRNHPYDKENTYVNPKGFKICRICRREAQRRNRG